MSDMILKTLTGRPPGQGFLLAGGLLIGHRDRAGKIAKRINHSFATGA